MSSCVVSVAGLRLAVELPSPSWLPALRERLGSFEVPGSMAPPDWTLRLRLEPHAPRMEREPAVEEGGRRVVVDHFEAEIPPEGDAELRIAQPGEEPEDATFAMVVDTCMRLALAQRLLPLGGVMLHAAGIRTSPQAGYVFFGRSGAGKTTVCQHSPRHEVLCDEVVAIRPGPGGDRLHGTPFFGAWGKGLAADAPLRGLFLLRQAPHHRLVELGQSQAVAALLAATIFYRRDAEATGQLLELLGSLVQRVPCQALEFRPEEALWKPILEASR